MNSNEVRKNHVKAYEAFEGKLKALEFQIINYKTRFSDFSCVFFYFVRLLAAFIPKLRKLIAINIHNHNQLTCK